MQELRNTVANTSADANASTHTSVCREPGLSMFVSNLPAFSMVTHPERILPPAWCVHKAHLSKLELKPALARLLLEAAKAHFSG